MVYLGRLSRYIKLQILNFENENWFNSLTVYLIIWHYREIGNRDELGDIVIPEIQSSPDRIF